MLTRFFLALQSLFFSFYEFFVAIDRSLRESINTAKTIENTLQGSNERLAVLLATKKVSNWV